MEPHLNILHIGLMVNRNKDIGLSRSFRKYANIYEEFPISDDLYNQIESLSFIPDIIFCQIQSESLGSKRTISLNQLMQELRNKGSFIMSWTGDCRNNIPEWMKYFNCDLTCFSNERDTKSFNGNSKFLQIGIDKEVFKFYENESDTEIVFMGNYNAQFPMANYRKNVVINLQRKYQSRFGVYGTNYPNIINNLNADPQNPYENQSRESKIYSGSKIAISISNYEIERYTSDRLLRAMGSHCMTLSHHYPGIEKDFEIGKHLDTFRNINDLHAKINYYLDHEDERERIAEAGYQHIHNNFTYDHMVKNIIKLKEHG